MSHRKAWRWAGAALLVGLVWASPAPAQDAPEDRAVLRDYYSGNGLLNRGLFDLAANEYKKFLAAHPQHEKAAVARYGLAVCYFRLGQHENAIPELNALVRVDGFEFAAESAMILGQSQHALGRYDEAASACQIVLERHLGHDLAPNACVLRAEALYRASQFAAAAAPCDLFIATWPDHELRERAELFRGLSDMSRNDFQGAADRLSAMLERSPDGEYSGQASLMLAQCLHRTKGLGRALSLYQKVIDEAQDEFVPDALYGLALLVHQQDDPGRAGELVDELLERYPESPLVTNATLLRGRVWFDLGEYDKALKALQSIAGAEGEHQDDAEYWIAKSELRLDRPADAAARFSRAIDAWPDSELRAEMMYDRAVALLRSGQDDAALAALMAFRKAYGEHGLAPDALQLMAATLHRQGKYEPSAARCAEFRQQYPDHELAASIDFLAAENEFLSRDYENAIREYRGFLRAHEGDEQAGKATFRLGMAWYQVGDFEQAEPALLQVVDGPDTEPVFHAALLALGDGYFQRGDWKQAESFLSDYLAGGADVASADDGLLKLGLALHRQEKRAEALEQYDRLIEDFPESPHRLQAIFERGQALVAMDDDEAARAAFEQVLDDGPASGFAPHAASHLGSIALRASAYENAADRFDLAAKTHTDEALAAEALFQAGQARMALKQFAEAESTFTTLIDEHSFAARRPQASAMRAIAMARQDKHDAALGQMADVEEKFLDELDAALKATLYYEKAWCLRALEKSEAAGDAYRAVIELNRRDHLHEYAMLELAELQEESDYCDGAVGLLESLLALAAEIDDTPPAIIEQATYRLGTCQFRLERFPEAATTLGDFIRRFDRSELIASASLLCGEALIKTGRHQEAAAHLVRVAEKHPQSEAYGPALLRLGDAYAAMSDWRRSEEVFDDYLRAAPDSELWFQARFGVGYAQENQNRFEDAIAAYRQVVDRHQGATAARAQFQIGECLYALKRFDEAAAELLKVDILYAYPEWSAAALYEAGRCFEELANPVEARKQFQIVVNDHADTEWARLARQRLDALAKVNLPGHAGGR